jgi:hypothetical protein
MQIVVRAASLRSWRGGAANFLNHGDMAQASPPPSKIKVVYIAGYGRSGTTLMSIALGQHPEIFGAGEIHELTRHAWSENTFCSCARPLQECDFWSAAVQRWRAMGQPSGLQDYVKLQKRFEHLLMAQMSRLGAGAGAKFESFAGATEALFRIIAATSGKGVVADSSKLPGRAWALAQMKMLDLYVVHMVRDGRGVAWSLMKSYKRDVNAGLQRDIKPKSTLRTCLRWSLVNLAAEDLRRVVGPEKYLRVRYEDFAKNPAAVMDRIGAMIGVDLQGVGADLAGGRVLNPNHQLAGNRLRLNASIKMDIDETWRSQMPEAKQRLFGRVCGWMLRRYDYAQAGR